MRNSQILTAILIAAVAVVVWLWLVYPSAPGPVAGCNNQTEHTSLVCQEK